MVIDFLSFNEWRPRRGRRHVSNSPTYCVEVHYGRTEQFISQLEKLGEDVSSNLEPPMEEEEWAKNLLQSLRIWIKRSEFVSILLEYRSYHVLDGYRRRLI